MKYPNGLTKEYKKKQCHANRGMTLENEINMTNEYYLNNNIAVVYKKPTPITINKVDFKSRNDATIKEAHFKIPSTTDYNGVYNGLYIDFEAKETRKLLFPLANIHKHQIEHLKKIYNCGGIGFIIVRFTLIDKTFCLSINKLLTFLNENKRKSIPLIYFEENGYLIKRCIHPCLDYLNIIEKMRSEI